MQSEERARRIRVTRGSKAVLRGVLQLGEGGAVMLSTMVGPPWALADKKLASRAGAMLRAGEKCDVKLTLAWATINEVVRFPKWRVEMLSVPRSVEVAAENLEILEPGSDG